MPGGMKAVDYLNRLCGFTLPVYPMWTPRVSASARGPGETHLALCDGEEANRLALCDAADVIVPFIADAPRTVQPQKRPRLSKPSSASYAAFVSGGASASSSSSGDNAFTNQAALEGFLPVGGKKSYPRTVGHVPHSTFWRFPWRDHRTRVLIAEHVL